MVRQSSGPRYNLVRDTLASVDRRGVSAYRRALIQLDVAFVSDFVDPWYTLAVLGCSSKQNLGRALERAPMWFTSVNKIHDPL